MAADFIGRTFNATQVTVFALTGSTHTYLGAYGSDNDAYTMAVIAGGDACKDQGITRVTFSENPAEMKRVDTKDKPGVDLELLPSDFRKIVNRVMQDLGQNTGAVCVLYILLKGRKCEYGVVSPYEDWSVEGARLVESFITFLGLNGPEEVKVEQVN